LGQGRAGPRREERRPEGQNREEGFHCSFPFPIFQIYFQIVFEIIICKYNPYTTILD
jgi:hypothetical protein